MTRGAVVAALLALAVSGCGYSLEGRGITTDPSIKAIGVPLFQDQTGRYDLDSKVTAAVMTELLKRGRFTVVRETSGVDAVVEGNILNFDVAPINFTASSKSTLYLGQAVFEHRPTWASVVAEARKRFWQWFWVLGVKRLAVPVMLVPALRWGQAFSGIWDVTIPLALLLVIIAVRSGRPFVAPSW